ncbi:glycoside hydrolase superfamily [Mrakia frigida]|uniref:glycoside hydrolase superfamily n=1 Tax=Mrakia frigida TaxID=29902 RepID=UPI003FCC04B0
MFEDINNSGDGGIYAELLQNRAFQIVDPKNQTAALYAWSPVGDASIAVVDDVPGVSAALPNSLSVELDSDGSAAFENTGYWGIKVDSSWTYKTSFYAKLASPSSSSDASLSASVSLVSKTSGTVFASHTFSSLTGEWKQYSIGLTPSTAAEDLQNSFVVQVSGGRGGEKVLFGLFSLFPPTYKGRENGMRIDLAETIAAVKPTVWRFPGGDNLEGQTFDTRWKWNETIGPISERPGRQGDWKYLNTDGLGLVEYLDWCEDLNAEPLMGIWSGYSLTKVAVAEEDLAPYVQAALDQIEFVIGDVSTPQGALRARYGHPKPWSLKYVEVGNEDFIIPAPTTYAAYRWKAFHDAIKQAYPHLKIIATTRPVTVLDPPEEYTDRHVYQTPEWFSKNAGRYDNDPRPGPLIFEGEYAATSTNSSDILGAFSNGRLRYSTLEAAVGEAGYMTGLERNSDIVFAAAYAPMLENIGRTQWTPNMILFDAGSVYPSPSYYTQKLFSTHRGDIILPVSSNDTAPQTFTYVASSTDSQVFVKTANYSPSPISLSLSLDGFKAKSATLEYLTGPHSQASNIPGKEVLVDIAGPFEVEVGKEGGVVVDLPGWSVGVVIVEV